MARLVGLDIGTSAVRAVEMEVGESQSRLEAFMQVALTPGAVVDGEVHDVASVTTALRQLWRDGDFHSKQVYVGLGGVRAISREVEIPWVPDDEVDSVVRYASEDVLPFSPEEMVLSSRSMGDFTGADGGMMRRVMVAAAHHDYVSAVVAAVEGAGLTPVALDLIPLALIRALSDPSYAIDQPEAIVSVGAGLTVVVVHQLGRPEFVRTIAVGGNTLSLAISGALDIPFGDGESLKRRIGFENSTQIQAAEKSVEAPTRELVEEVRNSLRFFASLPDRRPVARVLVTGGGSRLKGLLPRLQESLGVPVFPVSPLAKLDMSQVEPTAEQMAEMDAVIGTAVGLVEPDVFPDAQRVNLLPPEVAERALQRRIKVASIAAAIVLVVAIAGWGVWKWWQVHHAGGSITTLNARIAALVAQEGRLSSKRAVYNAEQVMATAELSAATGAVNWGQVINLLTGIVQSVNGQSGVAAGGFQITEVSGTALCAGSAAVSGGGLSPSSSTSVSCPPGTAAGAVTAAPGGIGQIDVTMTSGPTGLNPAASWITQVQRKHRKNVPADTIFGQILSTKFTTQAGLTTFESTVVINGPASMACDAYYNPPPAKGSPGAWPGCPK